jgi:hypothetical protein
MKVIEVLKGQTFTLDCDDKQQVFRCVRQPWPEARVKYYRVGFYVRDSDQQPVVIAKNQNCKLTK